MQLISSIVCECNVKWIHILRGMLNSLFFLIGMSVQKILETTWNNLIKRFLFVHLWECIFFSFLFCNIFWNSSTFSLWFYSPLFFKNHIHSFLLSYFPSLSVMSHYHDFQKCFYTLLSPSPVGDSHLFWKHKTGKFLRQRAYRRAHLLVIGTGLPLSIPREGQVEVLFSSSFSVKAALKLLQLIFSPHQVISVLMSDTNSQRWIKPDSPR